MTLLAEVVETWQRVGETSSRSAKIRELARCVGQLAGDEIEIACEGLSPGQARRRGRHHRGCARVVRGAEWSGVGVASVAS